MFENCVNCSTKEIRENVDKSKVAAPIPFDEVTPWSCYS